MIDNKITKLLNELLDNNKKIQHKIKSKMLQLNSKNTTEIRDHVARLLREQTSNIIKIEEERDIIENELFIKNEYKKILELLDDSANEEEGLYLLLKDNVIFEAAKEQIANYLIGYIEESDLKGIFMIPTYYFSIDSSWNDDNSITEVKIVAKMIIHKDEQDFYYNVSKSFVL